MVGAGPSATDGHKGSEAASPKTKTGICCGARGQMGEIYESMVRLGRFYIRNGGLKLMPLSSSNGESLQCVRITLSRG